MDLFSPKAVFAMMEKDEQHLIKVSYLSVYLLTFLFISMGADIGPLDVWDSNLLSLLTEPQIV